MAMMSTKTCHVEGGKGGVSVCCENSFGRPTLVVIIWPLNRKIICHKIKIFWLCFDVFLICHVFPSLLLPLSLSLSASIFQVEKARNKRLHIAEELLKTEAT